MSGAVHDRLRGQGDLFPHASPETVLAYLRRFQVRVLDVAPELSADDCLALLGDVALSETRLSRIAARIHATADYKHRASLPRLAVPIDKRRNLGRLAVYG